MKFYWLASIAAMACALPVAGASAQSLKEARAREASQQALEREAVYTRSVCGNDIEIEIDWESANGWGEDRLIAECDQALGAVEAACRRGDERARNVERFICAGDGKGVSLRNGELRYSAQSDADAFRKTKEAFADEQ